MFHFYILSYFFTTPILQQFFCFKYVFSGSVHGRLILYHPNSCPQILPTPHPSPVSVSVDFLAVASLGISENVQKISLFKDDRLEFALTSEEIFLDWKPHPLNHTLFLVTISLLIQEMRRLSLRSKEEILCFSVYMYVFSYSSYSVIYLYLFY